MDLKLIIIKNIRKKMLPSELVQVREAGTPHPRKKIKTYLGIMGFLWALEVLICFRGWGVPASRT